MFFYTDTMVSSESGPVKVPIIILHNGTVVPSNGPCNHLNTMLAAGSFEINETKEIKKLLEIVCRALTSKTHVLKKYLCEPDR